MTMKVDTIWTNVHLASMQSELAGLGEIKDAVVYAHQGVIVWVGPRDQAPDIDQQQAQLIDGKGGWLTPGLIDCHTHAVFAGDRAAEFKLRLEGASYQQIAEQGGGINSTVKATRAASFEQLLDLAKKHVNAMLANGVTTLEIKSGYGLDLATERKMLQVAAEIEKQLPVRIKKTFLGAHALPPEYAGRADDYIDVVVNTMLPTLHREGLVDAVDVFCENIGFTLAQTERVFAAAKALAIPVKIHAEQLSNLGGTELATQYGALSSDHIEYLDAAGIQKMQQAGTVAVLLPGAFYFLRETQCPPIDALRKQGIPMALATDFNPGSSPIASLLLMLNMGCTLFKMTTDEAILGVTRHAAQALGLADVVGQIKTGFRADMALWSINQPAELCYQFGINKLQARFFSKN